MIYHRRSPLVTFIIVWVLTMPLGIHAQQVGTIQGYKPKMPEMNNEVTPPSGEMISLDGVPVTNAQPYVLRNISVGQHTVSVSKPDGWTVGYTLCYNGTSCHSTTPIPGNSVVVNVLAGGYTDLWWHFTPLPVGFLDSIDDAGVVRGWEYDSSIPAVLNVELTVDGPTGTGVILPVASTSVSRPDVNTYLSITGDHGFSTVIPTSYRDEKNHSLFAYAVGANGIRTPLSASPKNFNLSRTNESVTKLVGIGYETWFPSIGSNGQRFWDNRWGTPLLGTYNSIDREVIDQHAKWLTSMGVDFILVDWSNDLLEGRSPDSVVGTVMRGNTDILIAEYARLTQLGIPHPKIAILLGAQNQQTIDSGGLQWEANYIYDHYIRSNSENYQMLNSAPLLVVYANTPAFSATPNWNDRRFNLRWMTGFLEAQPSLNTNQQASNPFWSWIDRSPQPVYQSGHMEAVTVTSAYPGQIGWLDSSAPYPARGRSGVAGVSTFSAQWNRAMSFNPKIVFLNQWNEFGGNGTPNGDQFTPELSNDLEPSVEFGCTSATQVQSAIAAWKRVVLPVFDCISPRSSLSQSTTVLSPSSVSVIGTKSQSTAPTISPPSATGGGTVTQSTTTELTKVILDTFRTQIQTPPTQSVALKIKTVALAAPCPNLTRNLSRGSRGTDVTRLQQFLISQNLLTSDSATGFFGAKTEAAVKKWQKINGITSSGTRLATGYGAIGPKTRATLTRCR